MSTKRKKQHVDSKHMKEPISETFIRNTDLSKVPKKEIPEELRPIGAAWEDNDGDEWPTAEVITEDKSQDDSKTQE